MPFLIAFDESVTLRGPSMELLVSIGQTEPGLQVLARKGFHTLGLQTYLMSGPKEARAWTIHQGGYRAAGRRGHPHRL